MSPLWSRILLKKADDCAGAEVCKLFVTELEVGLAGEGLRCCLDMAVFFVGERTGFLLLKMFEKNDLP